MVSGKVPTSMKYGHGRSGLRNIRFDIRLNSDTYGFQNGAQIRTRGLGGSGPGYGQFDKGLNSEV